MQQMIFQPILDQRKFLIVLMVCELFFNYFVISMCSQYFATVCAAILKRFTFETSAMFHFYAEISLFYINSEEKSEYLKTK